MLSKTRRKSRRLVSKPEPNRKSDFMKITPLVSSSDFDDDLYRSDTLRLPRDELGSRRSLIFLLNRVRLAPSLFFLSFCRETGSSPREGTRVLQDFPVRWWSTHFITRITHDLRIVLDASRPKRRIKVMLL